MEEVAASRCIGAILVASVTVLIASRSGTLALNVVASFAMLVKACTLPNARGATILHAMIVFLRMAVAVTSAKIPFAAKEVVQTQNFASCARLAIVHHALASYLVKVAE